MRRSGKSFVYLRRPFIVSAGGVSRVGWPELDNGVKVPLAGVTGSSVGLRIYHFRLLSEKPLFQSAANFQSSIVFFWPGIECLDAVLAKNKVVRSWGSRYSASAVWPYLPLPEPARHLAYRNGENKPREYQEQRSVNV